MLILRCLQAMMLVVVLLIAGVLLFDTFLVQEAAADCGAAYIACELAERAARAVCNREGWQSAACANATGEAVRYCIQKLHECAWGG